MLQNLKKFCKIYSKARAFRYDFNIKNNIYIKLKEEM